MIEAVMTCRQVVVVLDDGDEHELCGKPASQDEHGVVRCDEHRAGK